MLDAAATHSAKPNSVIDPLQLRRALGNFATGVTVVTALGGQGQLVGVTVNSFSSVSLAPPIVLWSLNLHSPSLAAFDACGRFVVNVLALDQMALSRRFSTSQRGHAATGAPTDKFGGVAYQRTAHGLPLLQGCAASFECRTEQRLAVGDHILFLGRVEAFAHHRAEGLLYCQGQYARGVALDEATSSVGRGRAAQAEPTNRT